MQKKNGLRTCAGRERGRKYGVSRRVLYCCGMRGDEKRVVNAFVAWLQDNGWKANTEVNFVDVYARRCDECLYAEAKGRTAAIGLDDVYEVDDAGIVHLRE